jgi:hypothetical protein
MFNSATLDILIGLMTIYLTVGLAVTALSEVVSQWTAMRARNLKRALVGMLDGSTAKGIGIRDHWFLSQPLITALTGGANEMPSYLDKKTFSTALLMAIDPDYAKKELSQVEAVIGAHSVLPPATKAILQAFLKDAGGDLEKFRKSLEDWFDSVMDRASGWYKRNIATVTLILSTVVVVGANIDTLAIGKALYGDPGLRKELFVQAMQLLKDGPPPTTTAPAEPSQGASTASTPAASASSASMSAASEAASATACAPAQPAETRDQQRTPAERIRQYHTELEELRNSGLPIGWQAMVWPSHHQLSWLTSKLAGWLITVFAASLGAPFWFDMLTRFVNIRSTGPKPQEPKIPPQDPAS